MKIHVGPVALLAVLTAAGCGGSGSNPILPLSNAQSVQTIVAAPAQLSFQQTGPAQSQTVVASTQFAGSLAAVSDNTQVATVNPPSADVATPPNNSNGVKSTTFTVTPVGSGSCTITITDKKGNRATVSVVVASSVPVSLLHQFAIPSGDVSFGIANAADGSVWYSEFTNASVGRMTAGGLNTNYAIDGGGYQSSQPYGMTPGPDGNFWVADYANHRILSVGSSGAVLMSYATAYAPTHITKGPDGNLWFTQEDDSGSTGYSEIVRMTTSGVMTHFPTSAAAQSQRRFAFDIAAGPDGKLWFTEGSAVGTVSTSGTLTEYLTPTGHQTQYLAAGPDGALWVTEPYGNHIARVTTAGSFEEVAVPALPWQIAAGKDGALWFSEIGGAQIGRLSTGGTETQYPVAGLTGQPALLSGSDGNLWVTSSSGTMDVLSY